MIKLRYNAPIILTFSLIAFAIYLVNVMNPLFSIKYFAVRSTMSLTNPLDYWRLVSHVLGHANWGHLFGNITFILLLGPILEEKYGSRHIFWMIFITALLTGLINVIFFSKPLLGASGIVFMLIILISIVDIEKGSIPLSFVLVALIFVGKEFVSMFQADSISQMAHIIGGMAGAAFGFLLEHRSKF